MALKVRETSAISSCPSAGSRDAASPAPSARAAASNRASPADVRRATTNDSARTPRATSAHAVSAACRSPITEA